MGSSKLIFHSTISTMNKLTLILVLAVVVMEVRGWIIPRRAMRGELSPAEEDMLEYLANLRDEQYQDDGELDYRQKRGRYGNKYADNKSYGFWISALNKAGNYKRGKRAVPFVPALSPMEAEHNPFQGYPDYSAAVELIPDKPIEKISH